MVGLASETAGSKTLVVPLGWSLFSFPSSLGPAGRESGSRRADTRRPTLKFSFGRRWAPFEPGVAFEPGGRKRVAQGVSLGTSRFTSEPRNGAQECRCPAQPSAPFRGFPTVHAVPKACALGYSLALLRSLLRVRLPAAVFTWIGACFDGDSGHCRALRCGAGAIRTSCRVRARGGGASRVGRRRSRPNCRGRR